MKSLPEELAVEIQTFLLAESIESRPGNRFDVRSAAISSFLVGPPLSFPARFSLKALLLLRRESCSGTAPFSLRFNLVDEDCQPAGLPHQALFPGVFSHGLRLCYLLAQIEFEFPWPGSYRLDITPDDGVPGDIYHYSIDICDGT